jgi:hypothetical protein
MKNLLAFLTVLTLSTSVAGAEDRKPSAPVATPKAHAAKAEPVTRPAEAAGAVARPRTLMARAFHIPSDFKDGSVAGSPTQAPRRARPA